MTTRLLLTVAAILTALPAAAQGPSLSEVKVSQRHLVPLCLDGEATKAARQWRLPPGRHAMAFTMRNQPRPGMGPAPGDSPGVAVVTFTIEEGHEYEVEVRAPAATYSTRVWEQLEWAPVVRDRTLDRLVSSDPRWTHEACRP